MKMKYAILTSAMMAVGMVGAASAGISAPPTPTIACGDEPYTLCMQDWNAHDGSEVSVEVELKCNGGEFDGGIYLEEELGELKGDEPYGNWGLYVIEGEDWVCDKRGYHDLLKTEGKCTNQDKGPTKGNKNHYPDGYDGRAVEYEFKTLMDDPLGCASD